MIVLPFPPASLSGHADGNRWAKSAVTKKWRQTAFWATKAANLPALTGDGDILLKIRFIPRDNRGDRVNFASRMKPLIDGIADALGVNDKRFLPSYEFYPPNAPGEVQVIVGPAAAPHGFPYQHRTLAEIEQ